ncbi:MAG: hypothetical protein WCY15_03470 [Phenylobacterium sp.]|jgi:hypothetical protein|uniref:hypothetical protein n=1 Tax=Phenylobacterium sp. TaxID=1871053 RepID=UPI002A3147C2|nr:hypothetical protein [Phenylobacterium sp.]MDD3838425.1 hypothetical protein [Phenylobacterium sp.]MDX9998254.1 hypothetical protein [Phenylobacterium sp.]
MNRRFSPRRRKQPLAVSAPLRTPLPGAVVTAVVRFSDILVDQGGGRTLMRLSEGRLADPEVRTWLGEAAPRAAGVSVLWDEREEEIVRVFEAPPELIKLAA